MFTFDKKQLNKLSKSDLVQIILNAQTTKELAPLPEEIIKETEVIQGYEYDSSRGSKIIKINGKKFKINYEKTNGSPLGFNYKMSASVMDESGKWNYVAEAKDIQYKSDVSYVSDEVSKRKDGGLFIKEMQKYLEKIYS